MSEWIESGERGPIAGADGLVFAAESPGRVIAVNATTGELTWETQLDSPIHRSPLHHGGTVYVGGDIGLVAIDATSGTETWTTGITGRIMTSPEAVAQDNVVAWAGNLEVGFNVAGVDASDGSINWTVASYRQFEVQDDYLVGFSPDATHDWPQTVMVWDTTDGSVVAEVAVDEDLDPFSISISPTTVYAGSVTQGSHGTLTAIATGTGRTAWTTALRGSLRLTAATAERIYVSATDRSAEQRGALHAVDAESGDLIWSLDLAAEARSQPLLAGDLVIIVSAEEVYYPID